MSYASRSATLNISNSVFSGNRATEFGGGIRLASSAEYDNSDMSIRSTLFEQNIAKNSGGAIAVDDYDSYDYLIENCTFRENMASVVGAAITFYKARHYVVIRGCTMFTRNINHSPDSSRGSVIGVLRAEAVLDNVDIVNNNCTGLYILKSRVTVNATVIIDNNHAIGSNGGGIRIECGNERQIPLEDAKLIVNKDSHLYVQNNKADIKGGGIYISRECILCSRGLPTRQCCH